MISYFEHNKFQKIDRIKQVLKKGDSVALITDAGTPGISDPAYKLIRKAIEIGCKVESIPGPSAAIASLIGVTSTTRAVRRRLSY